MAHISQGQICLCFRCEKNGRKVLRFVLINKCANVFNQKYAEEEKSLANIIQLAILSTSFEFGQPSNFSYLVFSRVVFGCCMICATADEKFSVYLNRSGVDLRNFLLLAVLKSQKFGDNWKSTRISKKSFESRHGKFEAVWWTFWGLWRQSRDRTNAHYMFKV